MQGIQGSYRFSHWVRHGHADDSVDSVNTHGESQGETQDETFVKLMGDKVESRRDYIQSNAKKVVNLDI